MWPGMPCICPAAAVSRIAVAHASIVGRGMVLQAKYFSYFRYWLFGLLMPTNVRKLIESDARHFLWAAAPSLRGDEDGAEDKVVPTHGELGPLAVAGGTFLLRTALWFF